MKSLKNKIILIFSILVGFIIIFSNKVEAASASITSSQTVTQGSSVTITGSVNAGAWNMTLSGAGQTKSLAGYTSTTANQSASTSITFTASTIGTYDFTFSGDITDYDTEVTQYYGSNGSQALTCTITVVAASSSSGSSTSDSTGSSGSTTSGSSSSGTTTTSSSSPVLTNLGISPYDFTGFKSSTTSYSVTVPNDCTSVTIYAKAASGVSITGIGTVTLKEGTNKYEIVASNSSGSTTYTLSIIRQTEETETIPNVIDEEETEGSESSGIGLTGLRITGYDFEEEFDPTVYEYTVKISEALTESDLEEIKNSITAITNTDEAYVEIETQLNEDGSAVITLIVKDDEREYATYTINFVLEDDVSAIAGTTSSDNSSGNFLDLLTNRKFIVIAGLAGILLLIVVIAVIAYKKAKRSRDEDEDNLIGSIYAETQGRALDSLDKNEDDKFENTDFVDVEEVKSEDKISEMLKDDSKIPEYSMASEESEVPEKETEIIDKNSDPIDLMKKAEEKYSELGGYRKRRRSFGRFKRKALNCLNKHFKIRSAYFLSIKRPKDNLQITEK